MKRIHVVALLLVGLMVASVVTVGVATATPVKKVPVDTKGRIIPTLIVRCEIKGKPDYPYRGEKYAITGYLKDPDTGKGIPSKKLDVTFKYWNDPYTEHCNANYWSGECRRPVTNKDGYYAQEDSAKKSPHYIYTVEFNGDKKYGYVKNDIDVYVGVTITTIATSNNHPARGQTFTLSGTVADKTGHGLAVVGPKDTVKVYRQLETAPGKWSNPTEIGSSRLYAGAQQQWRVQASGSTLLARYYAVYQGSDWYFSSKSLYTTVWGFEVE